ncbi:MAG: hypothetical protein IJK02_05835, partial [Clostridia bacterium]|nr:hypothetical protein [Clostridia bacterium]
SNFVFFGHFKRLKDTVSNINEYSAIKGTVSLRKLNTLTGEVEQYDRRDCTVTKSYDRLMNRSLFQWVGRNDRAPTKNRSENERSRRLAAVCGA